MPLSSHCRFLWRRLKSLYQEMGRTLIPELLTGIVRENLKLDDDVYGCDHYFIAGDTLGRIPRAPKRQTCSRNSRSTGDAASSRQTMSICVIGFSRSGRKRRPARRIARNDVGTIATPAPDATRLSKSVYEPSCTICGLKPAFRQMARMWSCAPGPRNRAWNTKGSFASIARPRLLWPPSR